MSPLDDVVEALCRYGQPSIWPRDDGTWACHTKMHTTLKVGYIEVKADPDCKTLRAAVESCVTNAAHTVATFEFKIGRN